MRPRDRGERRGGSDLGAGEQAAAIRIRAELPARLSGRTRATELAPASGRAPRGLGDALVGVGRDRLREVRGLPADLIRQLAEERPAREVPARRLAGILREIDADEGGDARVRILDLV